jgi:hypothetical protein
VKKSKLSRNVAPEYCAERRYVALATALVAATKASKVTTVDNMTSKPGRKAIRTKGRENHHLKKEGGKNARVRNVPINVQYLDWGRELV